MISPNEKLNKKEINSIVSSLFNNDIENLDIEKLKQIEPKDFYKEAIKLRKQLGWNASIKIPCNWQEDKAIKILEKLNECRLTLNGKQFEELWDLVSASSDISVWGGDDWNPRILPNGAVLIRNHHRVIGISDQSSGSIKMNNNQLREQLVELLEVFEKNFDIKDADYKFNFIHRSDEGFEWTSNIPEKLSDYGQTLFFMSTDLIEKAKEVLSDNHFIFEDNIENTASDSRTGHCVLRIFKDCSFIYSTYRASDEYDSILENYSYYLGETPNEEPIKEQVSSDIGFITQNVRRIIEYNDPPEIFSKSLLRTGTGNKIIRTLFSDKFYNGFAAEKSQQIMEFPPLFGINKETPTTYYSDEIPFLAYSKKFDGHLIVAKCYYAFLNDISNAQSQIEDNLSEIKNLIPNSKLQVYLPIPNKINYSREEDIFEYGSKDFQERLNLVVESLKEMHLKDLEENPSDENIDLSQSEKDWIDNFGYEFEFALLIITDENIDLFEVHKYGLRVSNIFNSTANLIVPAFGFCQGYSDGELDTGNVNIFLTPEEQEFNINDENEEDNYDDEDNE